MYKSYYHVLPTSVHASRYRFLSIAASCFFWFTMIYLEFVVYVFVSTILSVANAQLTQSVDNGMCKFPDMNVLSIYTDS